MPKQTRMGNSNSCDSQTLIDAARVAGADELRGRADAAPKVVRQYKSEAELDAETQAEALLKKAQSAFGSKE